MMITLKEAMHQQGKYIIMVLQEFKDNHYIST